MKYYLHDSNAFNDEKITELFIEFGYEGLGLFYTILEKIAAQEKPIKTNVLKSQLKVGKKLERCWSFMESIGLIQSIDGETFNIRLLNVSEKYKVKSEKSAKRVLKFREKEVISENVTRYESVCNANKLKEKKVIESNKEKSEILTNSNKESFILSIPEEWRAVITKWLNFKKEINNSYKGQTSLTTMFKQLKKISEENPIRAAEIIDYSIGNNYRGLFEPKIKQHSMVLYQSEQKVENF